MQTTSTSSRPTTSLCAKSTRSRQQHWFLYVNVDKTDRTIISRETESVAEQWRTTKELGYLLGDVEDLSRRKMLAVTAFLFMWSLCGLLYVVSGSETEKQDAFHRKQLQSLIRVHWPQRISNLKLYKRCRCRQISTDVMDMRWRPHPTLGREGACKTSNVCLLPSGRTPWLSRPTQNRPPQLPRHRPAAD